MKLIRFVKIFISAASFFGLSLLHCCFASLPASKIEQQLLKAMKTYHVPVVGYAVIQNYKIVAYNTLSIDPNLSVTTHSLFQAASISKSISAFGALILVSQQKLWLDQNINSSLSSWKIPSSPLTENQPVTLKLLLNMTSGLSVSGFPGHLQTQALPTLQEILTGKKPANTPAVQVFYPPGSDYYYSGGAYEVVEQAIEDSSHQKFPVWIKKQIFDPLSMKASFFAAPIPAHLKERVIPGFLLNGSMISGGWNNYSEYAASGLWSTPKDLALFAIYVSQTYVGKKHDLINSKIAKQMFIRGKNTDYGLGFVIDGAGNQLNFRKAGHNLGYHSELMMFPNTGDGIVIMTNSENGENVIHYIIPYIAQHNHWPYFYPFFDELIKLP